MQMSAKSYIRLFLGTVVGISLSSLLLPQYSWAQTTNEVNPLQDFESQQQEQNPFSSANDNPVGSIMDLMHRAQQGNIRSTSEYSVEQNKVIDDAAAQFRQRQLQMIQKPSQQGNPVPAVQNPQVAN